MSPQAREKKIINTFWMRCRQDFVVGGGENKNIEKNIECV